MSNIENIFSDRRKKERETRTTYSKYIFNSHLIMFLIIVLGAVMINYSRWLESASKFELYSVLIAASAIFSYLLVNSKVKTFIKEADAIFLLPLEKYYNRVAKKTAVSSSIVQIIILVVFYLALSPIINKIGQLNILSLVGVIIAIVLNVFYRLVEVIYIGEKFLTKVLLFLNIFLQLLNSFIRINYLTTVILVLVILFFVHVVRSSREVRKGETLLRWYEAAEYDKHREENYLKFVNMFVDVPLSGIKVARRKYFDILLPKLTPKNFNKENSFKYYYARVFLRQENTIFLALRLLVIGAIINYSFNNAYVTLVVIVSYSYLTIIQLVPLYKQIRNNIWHSILPVSEELKVKSFRSLLTFVMLGTTLILAVISIIIGRFSSMSIIFSVLGFVLANIVARIFIAKVK